MANDKKSAAPFGTWESPITPELLTKKSVSIGAVGVYEPQGKIYHLESGTIVENSAGGGTREVLPAQYSASSGIHEYGGGSFVVSSDGSIIFVDGDTRTVFSLNPATKEVIPITEQNEELRWADFDVHPITTRWVLAVKEDHRTDPVENLLVVIDASTKVDHVVARGADFYKAPRFSSDGKKVCWIQWSHPDMPWTGSELYVADWEDGKIGRPRYVAGKAIVECVDEPVWGLDNTLFFLSDKTGYLQLYRLENGADEPTIVNLKGLEKCEFGGRNPGLGSCTYVPLTETKLVAAVTKEAANFMVSIDLTNSTWENLNLPLCCVRDSAMARLSDSRVAVIGKTDLVPQTLYDCDVPNRTLKVVKKSSDIDLSETLISETQRISFPRVSGEERGGSSYCLFTPPKNPSFEGLPGTLPPLIVSLHGGPTSHTSPGLSLIIQYWTSRGYAWVDINYTGSSGYGRAYRDALNGKWGIADTDDSASCVAYLVSAGLVDGSRIGIQGGSAGGYGVLQALCIYPDLWAGGISKFGVSDVKALAADTHKFESHYLFKLMFKNGKEGLTEEEMERVYRERSPLWHADKIKAPVLLLQGTEDKVVPPQQAIRMESVIKSKGGDVKVVLFKGEGHGFRRADSMIKDLEEEGAWWLKTLVR